MKKLRIAGSSFLNPKNKGWLDLGRKYDLSFSEYGDWAGSLLDSTEYDELAVILFLEDFCTVESGQIDLNKELLKLFIQMLVKQLDVSRGNTLISIAYRHHSDPIRNAKSRNTNLEIHNWFINSLYELADRFPNLFVDDLNTGFSELGFFRAYDDRNWYFSRCRISTLAIEKIAKNINAILNRKECAASKVLVLDCDNTIWGGVIGEDGLENILLGQDGIGKAFLDFQKSCKYLSEQGVVLVLASKNNEEDVWEMFDKHSSMALKKSDIVAAKINWSEKSQNIHELARELDLGLDSFVFWDDNPLERDKMRDALPEVLTVEPAQQVIEWPNHLLNLECFAKFRVTADDRKKVNQYRSRAEFVKESSLSDDESDYLKSIGLKASPYSLTKKNISRAIQLSEKTNQYNLRTVRYDQVDLEQLTAQGDDFVFLVGLVDKYGDHGLVGMVCLRRISDDVVFLDNLMMSCRVLGRHLESWILKTVSERMRLNKFKFLVGEFIPTQKNKIASEFFSNHNFNILNSDNQVNPLFLQSKELLELTGIGYWANIEDLYFPFLECYE